MPMQVGPNVNHELFSEFCEKNVRLQKERGDDWSMETLPEKNLCNKCNYCK